MYAVTHAISRLLMLSVTLRSLNPLPSKLSLSPLSTYKTLTGICTVDRLRRRLYDCMQEGVMSIVDLSLMKTYRLQWLFSVVLSLSRRRT
jgi:hypothetical protein